MRANPALLPNALRTQLRTHAWLYSPFPWCFEKIPQAFMPNRDRGFHGISESQRRLVNRHLPATFDKIVEFVTVQPETLRKGPAREKNALERQCRGGMFGFQGLADEKPLNFWKFLEVIAQQKEFSYNDGNFCKFLPIYYERKAVPVHRFPIHLLIAFSPPIRKRFESQCNFFCFPAKSFFHIRKT